MIHTTVFGRPVRGANALALGAGWLGLIFGVLIGR